MGESSPVCIGVLALQGSFREHMAKLQQVPNVKVVEVRTEAQLASVTGLIIPGGESTTMANIAERWGLMPALKSFATNGRPVWGTCAGMIFLAERAQGVKKGGQGLLGGLDITVSRNHFGAQVNSFETQLPIPPCLSQYGGEDSFRAIFIRAPAVTETGPGVEVLAEVPEVDGDPSNKVGVAVRSGTLLATAFHPELTDDVRWHELFVDMVRQHANKATLVEAGHEDSQVISPPARPADLPVYR